MIDITRDEYVRLLKRDEELLMLEMAGVDNWQGCDYAYNPEKGENFTEAMIRIEAENPVE